MSEIDYVIMWQARDPDHEWGPEVKMATIEDKTGLYNAEGELVHSIPKEEGRNVVRTFIDIGLEDYVFIKHCEGTVSAGKFYMAASANSGDVWGAADLRLEPDQANLVQAQYPGIKLVPLAESAYTNM